LKLRLAFGEKVKNVFIREALETSTSTFNLNYYEVSLSNEFFFCTI